MARKQIKIGHRKVTFLENRGVETDLFEVISLKNSTDYMPKQRLTKPEVDALCQSTSWEVTLVPLEMKP